MGRKDNVANSMASNRLSELMGTDDFEKLITAMLQNNVNTVNMLCEQHGLDVQEINNTINAEQIMMAIAFPDKGEKRRGTI